MTDVVWAAVITTGGVLAIALGGGLWRIITMILQTYKDQASATVDAKDAEIARLRDGVTARLDKIDHEMGELRQDLWTLRRESRA
jgi:hypothetical protein